jgi:hypothetical protein
VHLLTNASEFLDRTRAFRARESYLTNVIGSTASSIAAGHRTYERVSFWILEGPIGEVRRIMMRTAPHKLVISPVRCRSVLVTQSHQFRKGESQSAQREFTPLTKRSACTIFAPRMFQDC